MKFLPIKNIILNEWVRLTMDITSLKFIFSSIFSNSDATSWSDIWSMFQPSSSTSLKSPTEHGLCKVPGGYRPFTLPGKPPTILSIWKEGIVVIHYGHGICFTNIKNNKVDCDRIYDQYFSFLDIHKKGFMATI